MSSSNASYYLAVSQASNFFNQNQERPIQHSTPYEQCRNEIYLQSLKGNTEAHCSKHLTDRELNDLRKDGFVVHTTYFPWKYENDLWDPITGNRVSNIVKWANPNR